MTKKVYILPLIFFTAVLFCGKNKESKDNEAKDPASDTPGIIASVDRAKVNVGDVIALRLRYSLPEGAVFSENDLSGLEGLTISGKKAVSRPGNPRNGEIFYSILADKTASFDIGPVSLSFKDKKGVLNIIRSGILHIDVSSNLGRGSAELKPIMDIIATYPLWLKLLPWILGILILGGAGAAIYFWKKRKKKEAELLKNLRPPHEIAKEEIEKLVRLNLTGKGMYKEFYFSFSEILRQYLESLRGFPAAEFTIEEIARRIGSGRNAGEDKRLVVILREADMVKFADSIPDKVQNENHVAGALEYIRITTPPDAISDMEKLTPSLE